MLFQRTFSSSQICTKEQFVGEKATCRPIDRHGQLTYPTPSLRDIYLHGFSSAN
jgi:hypothetical protein